MTVIQDASLVAVQTQPSAAVTETVPVLPPAAAPAAVGVIVGSHGAPAWVTVKIAPAMVRVPERGVAVALASTS